MAKTKTSSVTKPATKEEFKSSYPIIFGSHLSMIDEEATAKLDDKNKVVCVDDHGSYETLRSRLDSGLADPNRYPAYRLSKLYASKAK